LVEVLIADSDAQYLDITASLVEAMNELNRSTHQSSNHYDQQCLSIEFTIMEAPTSLINVNIQPIPSNPTSTTQPYQKLTDESRVSERRMELNV